MTLAIENAQHVVVALGQAPAGVPGVRHLSQPVADEDQQTDDPTLFANLGGASFGNQAFKLFNSATTVETPIIGAQQVGADLVSLQTFALGFPVHFDWSSRTLFNRDWEDVVFARDGGSAEFRKPKFTVWIGYDF